jgi:hypothetical protein
MQNDGRAGAVDAAHRKGAAAAQNAAGAGPPERTDQVPDYA